MGVTQKTPMEDIVATIGNAVSRALDAIVYNMAAIGEQVVNRAREKGSYTDRTGNLRGSTGYVVVRDGTIVNRGGFSEVRGPEPNPAHPSSEGPAAGATLAEQLAGEIRRGQIALIVVAGQSYARYVSARGYDVLDSSNLLARKLVPQMLKELGYE